MFPGHVSNYIHVVTIILDFYILVTRSWGKTLSKITIRAKHFRFGPVLDQNKQPNWIFFFLVLESNQKPVQTD
jgi:hypothetical protein